MELDLKVEGNIYTRIMNPTNAVLEARMAAMEGGIAALAVASGMAAITYAIQCIAGAGDNIISTTQLYGGTYNLFAHSLPRQGIEVRMASFDANPLCLKFRIIVNPDPVTHQVSKDIVEIETSQPPS